MNKLKIIYKKGKEFFLPFLSGVLLFLAYPPQNLWFLVFAALIPLFWFLFSEKTSLKRAFWGGSITGFVFMSGLFIWLFHTAPFEWLGVNSEKSFVLVLILMIILWCFQVFLLGISFGAFCWFLKKFIKTASGIFTFLIVVPFSWAVFEYLRAWWFEFIWLGKETFFGPHWTFGALAYALHNVPLFLQSADLWGIYGIGFIIALINVSLFLILDSGRQKILKKQIIALVLIIFIAFSFLFIYGKLKMKINFDGEKREIALMQTNFLSDANFNAYHKEEICKLLTAMFQQPGIKDKNPDFIIAPEGLGIVSCYGNNLKIAQSQLKDFWKSGQIYLESRKTLDENGKIKSRLFYYDLEKDNPVAYYEKRLLVANGDFLPYVTKLLLNVYSFASGFEKRLYQKGEIDFPATTPKGIIGGTICSSILSPEINRQMTGRGAEILMVVSSDAPFHGSKPLLTQNLAMSKLRAIENRRYFVQSTNMGYAFLLNPKGEIVLKSQKFGNEIQFANVKLLNQKTFYVRFGDWFVLLAFAVLLTGLAYPRVLTFLKIK